MHDIYDLEDVKTEYNNCVIIGDKGYINAEVQLDLFETVNN